MSNEQNNQNDNIDDNDSIEGDNEQESVETPEESSALKAEEGVDVAKEESEQEESQVEEEEPDDLTNEEIIELKKKAEERDTYLDQLLRTKAEFVNYQKRMVKENESASQFAIQSLVLDFLPELDNFDRALKLADNSNDIEKFVEGIKLIEEQLLKVLGKYGVEVIETEGKAFDPNLHEAVMEEENNEMDHHTIIDEFQKGFLLKERVIRPSKVKVSKKTVEDDDASDE